MKETTLGTKVKRVVLLAVLFALPCGAIAGPVPPPIVLTNGNSQATIDPSSSAGMNNWTVGGVNQLNQQWFWFGVGAGPVAAINTIGAPVITGVSSSAATTTYGNGSYSVGVTYTLTGGANGGGPGTIQSDIGESINILNTSGSTLLFHFYEYSDFNLQGPPNADTVTLYGTPLGGYSIAYQNNGVMALSETVVAPTANHGESELTGVTLAKLNGGTPVTLSDNASAGPGNVTWALEWDLTIANGASALISKDKFIEIQPTPEPTVLALFGLGAIGFAVQRRRRRCS